MPNTDDIRGAACRRVLADMPTDSTAVIESPPAVSALLELVEKRMAELEKRRRKIAPNQYTRKFRIDLEFNALSDARGELDRAERAHIRAIVSKLEGSR